MDETTTSDSCKSSNSDLKEQNSCDGKSLSECRLWIGNLDVKVREFHLLKMVEKFGSLAEFDFLYHRSGPQIGQPRGYAFVTYKELEDARKAQKTLDGLEVFSRKLAVKWAHAQDETKFITKPKAVPPILSISKETSSKTTKKTLSKEKKIAALEEQLKLLDENRSGDMAFTPDIGAPSRPTTVIYNYIERNTKVGNSQGRGASYRSNYSEASRPYNKRTRRK